MEDPRCLCYIPHMQWSVVGHDEQKEYIDRLITTGKLAHAYLLEGPQGVGKRLFAQEMMRALVPEAARLDWTVVEPERDDDGRFHDIPIKAVQGLKAWVALRPTSGRKVILIDDAERLGDDAADALLKILEEPPAYAHFLLVSSRLGQMVPTIASRCQHLRFPAVPDDDVLGLVRGHRPDADDLRLLAAVAAGRPGIALRLLQQKQLPVVAEAIAGLEQALKSGIAERILAAKELAERADLPDVLQWWLSWTRAQLPMRPQLAAVAHGLLGLSETVDHLSYNRRLALENFFLSLP